MSELTPVAPRERVATLDVLRGFALWGVLIGNLVLYSGRWAARGGPEPSPLDRVAGWLVAIFVESKAQTTLTLLFGFGFAVQLLRADARGEPVMPVYLRRLGALFVLGSLHVLCLWWGDVTWTYAVAGVGLLAFTRASNRVRLIAAAIATFVPLIVLALWPSLQMTAMQVFVPPREFMPATARMAAALHDPDRTGLWWEHARYALIWVSAIWVWYFLWTLGRFLIGYVAGARRWFDRDGADHLPGFRRVAAIAGVLGALTSWLMVLERLEVIALSTAGTLGRVAAVLVEQVGLLAMALFYVAIVVLLMQRPRARRVLSLIAPAGRMALTTYFSQSVICTVLFYGWGLHWAGHVGAAGCLALALVVYPVQIALAHLWLRHFRFGPLEWVWRTAVYARLQPMRRAATPAPD